MTRQQLRQQRAHVEALHAVLRDMLYGERFDEIGNRDDNGLFGMGADMKYIRQKAVNIETLMGDYQEVGE